MAISNNKQYRYQYNLYSFIYYYKQAKLIISLRPPGNDKNSNSLINIIILFI